MPRMRSAGPDYLAARGTRTLGQHVPSELAADTSVPPEKLLVDCVF